MFSQCPLPDPALYGAHDTNCTFFSSQHKSSTKMALISLARDFSTYFSRIYPVAANSEEVSATIPCGLLAKNLGLSLHCNENPIYVFPEKELRGFSHNFHIHVSVSDLFIPRIGPHIFLQQNRMLTDGGNM